MSEPKCIYVKQGELIRDAIEKASAGDTILLNAGSWGEERLTIEKPVHLVGASGRTIAVEESEMTSILQILSAEQR